MVQCPLWVVSAPVCGCFVRFVDSLGGLRSNVCLCHKRTWWLDMAYSTNSILGSGSGRDSILRFRPEPVPTDRRRSDAELLQLDYYCRQVFSSSRAFDLAAAQQPTEAERTVIRSACRSDFVMHCASVRREQGGVGVSASERLEAVEAVVGRERGGL